MSGMVHDGSLSMKKFMERQSRDTRLMNKYLRGMKK